MTVRRMDNVGIVVDDIKSAIAFFQELGLDLEGETTVEGPAVDRTIGLEGVRSDIAMLRTANGDCRLELSSFHSPRSVAGDPNAPVNRLGMGRIMFTVDDIEDTVGRLQSLGATLIGEVTPYGDTYKLCYIRGPEGIIIALAEEQT